MDASSRCFSGSSAALRSACAHGDEKLNVDAAPLALAPAAAAAFEGEAREALVLASPAACAEALAPRMSMANAFAG